mmetsp:Transcript_118357/g.307434  ORF Transcript_118357/g.307434 Transcript_118357/m.307434 type:complete len:234 (-) Transcript_118357:154-855(-)
MKPWPEPNSVLQESCESSHVPVTCSASSSDEVNCHPAPALVNLNFRCLQIPRYLLFFQETASHAGADSDDELEVSSPSLGTSESGVSCHVTGVHDPSLGTSESGASCHVTVVHDPSLGTSESGASCHVSVVPNSTTPPFQGMQTTLCTPWRRASRMRTNRVGAKVDTSLLNSWRLLLNTRPTAPSPGRNVTKPQALVKVLAFLSTAHASATRSLSLEMLQNNAYAPWLRRQTS